MMRKLAHVPETDFEKALVTETEDSMILSQANMGSLAALLRTVLTLSSSVVS